MKKPNLFVVSLASMGGLALYVAGVALFMGAASSMFGDEKTFLIPMAMLLLFVLSAAVTGSLFLGYPLYLYFEGKKKEALRLFAYNLEVLLFMTALAFVLMWFVNPHRTFPTT